MDPKKIAEELIKSLFASQNNISEEYEEDEEEGEEGEDEEDEGDEHEQSETPKQEKEEHASNSMSKDIAGSAAKSVTMKPTGNMASQTNAGSGTYSSDAHGGSTHDAMGKSGQFIQPVAQPGVSQQAAATLQMKPSWAGVQMPTLDRGQMTEDVRAMFGGSEDLSEEFVNKAADLYEATILTNLQNITEQLTEEFSNKLIESVTEVATTLEEQVDNYLNYVVDEWMKENKLVVEQGLRTEIAENFISGLKNLFAESYIEVPEEKVNVFDEMANAVNHLETRVNEELEKNVQLVNEINDLKASLVFAEETETLSDLDAENVKKLVENLRFDNENNFRNKVQTLVEGYVKSKVSRAQKVEQVDSTVAEETNNQPVFINESIKRYAEVLGKTIKG
jgi:hypothetical protein